MILIGLKDVETREHKFVLFRDKLVQKLDIVRIVIEVVPSQ